MGMSSGLLPNCPATQPQKKKVHCATSTYNFGGTELTSFFISKPTFAFLWWVGGDIWRWSA
jgi:hypothetical protein